MHVGHKSLSIYIENPDVLNISQCTHDIPHIHHDIPLMYSWNPVMYSWYPPMYSWYPPNVLMVSPQCTEQLQYTGDTYRVFMPDEFLFHILLTADKILNQIKSKISSQPKMEESMTQETAWFRTYAIRTDPPPPPPPPPPSADSLVNSQLLLTSDREKFEQWCFVRLVSRSPGRCRVRLGQ